MATYTELPLFKAGYDLTIEIFKTTKDFNKEYKYTLGERIKSNGLDLMLLLYRANSIKDKARHFNWCLFFSDNRFYQLFSCFYSLQIKM